MLEMFRTLETEMREPMPPAPPNTLAALDMPLRGPGLPEALELEKFRGAALDLEMKDMLKLLRDMSR